MGPADSGDQRSDHFRSLDTAQKQADGSMITGLCRLFCRGENDSSADYFGAQIGQVVYQCPFAELSIGRDSRHYGLINGNADIHAALAPPPSLPGGAPLQRDAARFDAGDLRTKE